MQNGMGMEWTIYNMLYMRYMHVCKTGWVWNGQYTICSICAICMYAKRDGYGMDNIQYALYALYACMQNGMGMEWTIYNMLYMRYMHVCKTGWVWNRQYTICSICAICMYAKRDGYGIDNIQYALYA